MQESKTLTAIQLIQENRERRRVRAADLAAAKQLEAEADQLASQQAAAYLATRSRSQSRGKAAPPPNSQLQARVSLEFKRQIEEFRAGIPSSSPKAAVAADALPVASPKQRLSALPSRLHVYLRKRPLNAAEVHSRLFDVVTVIGEKSVTVHVPKLKVDLSKSLDNHDYTFDGAFDEATLSDEVYRETTRPHLASLISGGHLTVLAFGQTGSGKTYTMNSVIAGAVNDLFSLAGDTPVVVSVSYFEVYMSKVFDLLDERREVTLREDGSGIVQVVGLTSHEADDANEVLDWVATGQQLRRTASTQVNADSSRSHAILQIQLTSQSDGKTQGKLCLVDLAGSERAADMTVSDARMRSEAAAINKSLLALKECIRALDKNDSSHVPFRGSKLTQLLRDCFTNPHARTVMIGAISPSSQCCEHTLNTLRYIDRLKEIGSKPVAKVPGRFVVPVPTATAPSTRRQSSAGLSYQSSDTSDVAPQGTVRVRSRRRSDILCAGSAQSKPPSNPRWNGSIAQTARRSTRANDDRYNDGPASNFMQSGIESKAMTAAELSMGSSSEGEGPALQGSPPRVQPLALYPASNCTDGSPHRLMQVIAQSPPRAATALGSSMSPKRSPDRTYVQRSPQVIKSIVSPTDFLIRAKAVFDLGGSSEHWTVASPPYAVTTQGSRAASSTECTPATSHHAPLHQSPTAPLPDHAQLQTQLLEMNRMWQHMSAMMGAMGGKELFPFGMPTVDAALHSLAHHTSPMLLPQFQHTPFDTSAVGRGTSASFDSPAPPAPQFQSSPLLSPSKRSLQVQHTAQVMIPAVSPPVTKVQSPPVLPAVQPLSRSPPLQAPLVANATVLNRSTALSSVQLTPSSSGTSASALSPKALPTLLPLKLAHARVDSVTPQRTPVTRRSVEALVNDDEASFRKRREFSSFWNEYSALMQSEESHTAPVGSVCQPKPLLPVPVLPMTALVSGIRPDSLVAPPVAASQETATYSRASTSAVPHVAAVLSPVGRQPAEPSTTVTDGVPLGIIRRRGKPDPHTAASSVAAPVVISFQPHDLPVSSPAPLQPTAIDTAALIVNAASTLPTVHASGGAADAGHIHVEERHRSRRHKHRHKDADAATESSASGTARQSDPDERRHRRHRSSRNRHGEGRTVAVGVDKEGGVGAGHDPRANQVVDAPALTPERHVASARPQVITHAGHHAVLADDTSVASASAPAVRVPMSACRSSRIPTAHDNDAAPSHQSTARGLAAGCDVAGAGVVPVSSTRPQSASRIRCAKTPYGTVHAHPIVAPRTARPVGRPSPPCTPDRMSFHGSMVASEDDLTQLCGPPSPPPHQARAHSNVRVAPPKASVKGMSPARPPPSAGKLQRSASKDPYARSQEVQPYYAVVSAATRLPPSRQRSRAVPAADDIERGSQSQLPGTVADMQPSCANTQRATISYASTSVLDDSVASAETYEELFKPVPVVAYTQAPQLRIPIAHPTMQRPSPKHSMDSPITPLVGLLNSGDLFFAMDSERPAIAGHARKLEQQLGLLREQATAVNRVLANRDQSRRLPSAGPVKADAAANWGH